MFFGRWPYRVDSKGRVAIPPIFRKNFKELILTIEEGAIRIYSEKKAWMNLEDIYILDNNLYRDGRLLIPIQLRKKVSEILLKDVEWVGKDDYLELNVIRERIMV
jgi:DNA-binding transcriptional regulator/RsmH inhibitor MraZ